MKPDFAREDMLKLLSELKAIRERKGLTQANIAESLSLSKDGYRKIESGKNPLSLERLLQLCQVLNISPGDFFGNTVSYLFDQNHFEIENKRLLKGIEYLLSEVSYLREQNNKLLQCINPDLNDMRVVRDK